jgi:Uncharacterized conserved protein (DUF2203)
LVAVLHERHWTPDEANALRPIVGAIVRRIRAARRLLSDRGFDAGFTVHAEASGGAWPGLDSARAALEVALGFEQLEELDIVVRDLERGLIDFPAVIDGREVYLCWLLDEPSVTHWHAIEAGFAGRRPL